MIWPPSYQKLFYWRAVWYTKSYPIFHRVVRLKPADSLSKWIYAPELWDVIYFMASAGDVMAGTVLTNDPRCSRCQPEIGGAVRKTTRDARYDSRGKLSQRRGTGGWNVSLLQFRHLLFSITISLMWRIWRPNIARLGPQFQLVNQWWLIHYSELNLQSVTLPISHEKFMMIWSMYDFWIKRKIPSETEVALRSNNCLYTVYNIYTVHAV